MTICWKYLFFLLCFINWNKWERVLDSSANEVVVWDEIGKEGWGHVVSPSIFWLMTVYSQMLLLVNHGNGLLLLGCRRQWWSSWTEILSLKDLNTCYTYVCWPCTYTCSVDFVVFRQTILALSLMAFCQHQGAIFPRPQLQHQELLAVGYIVTQLLQLIGMQ